MFEAGVALDTDPQLREASERAFAVLRARRGTAGGADAGARAAAGLMVALHVWSMTHGIASLFGRGDAARRALPMPPEELLEAAVLIYLRGLGLPDDAAGAVALKPPACPHPIRPYLTRRPAGFSYVNVIYIHARSTMPITAKLDEFGKPAWIALIVLGFMAWWPLGLCVLAFTIGSGRMGCCGFHGGHGRWQAQDGAHAGKMDWMRANEWQRWRPLDATRRRAAITPSTNIAPKPCAGSKTSSASSSDFLERLRFAKDKTEFDAFMAERRNRPEPQSPPRRADPRLRQTLRWAVRLPRGGRPFVCCLRRWRVAAFRAAGSSR